MLEGFNFLEKPQGGQVFHNGFPGFVGGHAGILAAVQHLGLIDGGLAGSEDGVGLRLVLCAGHVAVIGEHPHDGQIVALAHFKVVGIVGGGDLHHAGALFHVRVLVAHDGDFLVDEGQDHVTAVEMGVAGVVGVNGHGGIAQHGFGAGGGQLQLFARLLHGIEDVPEIAVLFDIFHFGVGDGGHVVGAPVHQAVAPVDEALFIQPHEHLAHGLGAALVHGEALPVPVAARAHAAKLAGDAPAVLPLPGPGVLQEAFAAQHFLGESLAAELFHHLHLGGDGCVVGAGQPEGGVALHAVVADQRILKRGIHGVAHVQLPRHVGRRHHDGKGLLALVDLRGESAAFFPLLVGFRFNRLGIVGFFHSEFFRHGYSSSQIKKRVNSSRRTD